MSLGRQRFSIIPAMAVTDPRLQPRDLQVLCLLGRHTDNRGWCCRSQVKMAKERSCGRRTVQRALERLNEAGYLEYRVNERASGAAAAHDYRVVIDPSEAEAQDDFSGEIDTGFEGENGSEIEPDFRETPLRTDEQGCSPVSRGCSPMDEQGVLTHGRAPMLTTQDKRIGGVVARARARDGTPKGVSRKIDPPPEPQPQTDLVSRGKRVCEAMGIAWDDPHWKGDVFVLTQWDAAGFDFELDVLPTIASICRSKPELPGSLSYFTKPIARNHQARLAPPDLPGQHAGQSGWPSGGKNFHEDLVERQNAAIAAAFQEDEE